MPKPTKRPTRNDPDSAEDDIDPTPATSGYANAAREASANASFPAKTGLIANSSELSTEALLQRISMAVAEEGQRTQQSLLESFNKFEATVDAKLNSIMTRIDAVVATTDALSVRVTESEARISGLEDGIAPLKKRLDVMEQCNKALADKVLDLEGRSRRDNIRILNLKEATEGSDLTIFLEGFIPKLLKLPVTSVPIDRAHRGFGVPGDGRPRPIIIKLQRSRDVRVIMTAAKRQGAIQHDGSSLRIVPDVPPSVRMARRAFNAVCSDLIKKNIRFLMAYPAVLSFTTDGIKKTFRDPNEAAAFLNINIGS
ncbi:unnamed protein product [Knipowitschia caucasica]|uniref:LINE-1 type transposase domain-containing protein 1 n=1 Tax=Knipowitschia caucasica TaxID=637954 RepID=A0AAV2IXK1_KNICA